VKVANKAPKIKHGLVSLSYPTTLDDVPLRIGLDQIREEKGADEITMKTITIPVRMAASTDKTVKDLRLYKETVKDGDANKEITGCILLVQTNDPEYKDLGTIDGSNRETEQLMWVGEVDKETFKANTKDDVVDNKFEVKFYDDFKFKEGYFYRLRFQYEEDPTVVEGETPPDICKGQDVFTIKVVPKYLLWTGSENLNWNNDANWSRVGKGDLYVQDRRAADLAHYITDGLRNSEPVNDNVNAYAPLDFTHVIVQNGVESPYMYGPASAETDMNKDLYKKSYNWSENPNLADGDETKYADYPTDEKGVGDATACIQYDMAAFYPYAGNVNNVGCRPWYVNTCKEIHFKPGGTVMNQHELTYEKAWVDVELDPKRWYLLSSPLKETYSGDFYLPTNGARQETELYQDITFSKGTHDRFKPAVFQRGWDKGTANVYELGNAEGPRNVAVKTFWSHVYNDVKEQYGGGVGFSIKTDVSAISVKPDRVMFRLPKADTSFDYWKKNSEENGHNTPITRGNGHYKLNDEKGTIKVSTATEGKYFLVGNPFMTHLDIAKFIEGNSTKLENNFWIVGADGQTAGTVTAGGVVTASPADDSDPSAIAPMQGFFVKAKNNAKELELSYNEMMMRRYDSRVDKTGEYLTGMTRAEGSVPSLRIVAENYGEPSSAALLLTAPSSDGVADWSDVEAIDNRSLDVLSTVYTVKDGHAMSLCRNDNPDGVEVGVIADDDTETVLRFEGVEAVDGLCLYDKDERTLTPLEEGMEVTVKGAAAGRLFLTSGLPDDEVVSGIDWRVADDTIEVTDLAASGFLKVNVYDTVGQLVRSDGGNTDMVSISLPSGIYVVEMVTAKERKCVKIRF